MMSLRGLVLLLCVSLPMGLRSQTPKVPSRMEFADIKLRIMEDVRDELQKDVDALTKNPKYFNIKVERAKSYFPIIERIFKEEGIHDDFKYLVLQESSLISDAVSVSDAVGFWQFKDFTAMEVGMRVDKQVDERMNIVSSSRGAAQYMIKNNEFFDNWLHALQAYQMGAGGAMRVLGEKDKGAKSMVIDKKTYWYVKKYLAHKIAFQHATSGPPQIQLLEYETGRGKSLNEISSETGVALDKLEEYNKWLKRGKIPEDRIYTVIIPVEADEDIKLANIYETPETEEKRSLEYDFPVVDNFPNIEDLKGAMKGHIVEINDLPGVIGASGDKIADLAKKGNVDLSKFLKYNEIQINDQIQDGQVYYYKKKKSNASVHYYVAQPGEDLWYISQKFGVRLKKLLVKNRMKDESELKPGRVLWMRYIRPSKVAAEYRDTQPKPEPKPVNIEMPVESETSLKEKATQEMAKADPEMINDALEPIDDDSSNQSNEDIDDKEEIETADEDVDTSTATAYFESRDTEVVADNNGNDDTPSLIDREELNEIADQEAEEPRLLKKVHIVEPKQTLYSIAKLYNVSVIELLDWNNLKITDKLSINQKLVILTKPDSLQVVEDKEEEESHALDTYSYHVVNTGDTIYNIARYYNVTIEDLMTWNNKKDFSLSLGEKIKIKKKSGN